MINRLTGILSLLLLLNGCSTMQVNVDYDQTVTFDNLQSYAWVPGTPEKSNNPKLDSDTLLHDRIQGAINSWLSVHGYQQKPLQQADFLVAYRVIVEDKTSVTVLNDYYGYPMGWRYGYYRPYGTQRTYVYDYQQGTIIIDIVDPKTRKLMRRGSASDEVREKTTPEKRQQKITEAVDAILKNFPPGKK